MGWVRLEDRMPDDEKVVALGDRAFRLYVTAMCYCRHAETDGRVPTARLAHMTRTANKKVVAELMDAALLRRIEGDYEVPNYLKYNPSAQELAEMEKRAEEEREASRLRKRNWRLKRDEDRDGNSDVTRDSRVPRARDTRVGVGWDKEGDKDSISETTAEVDARAREVREVFDAWVLATERDAERTKLSPDRRRKIEQALKADGLEVCLAAVANIGKDPWARGENDRGTRFDDISHALGSAERRERWSQRTQPPKPQSATTARRLEWLGIKQEATC